MSPHGLHDYVKLAPASPQHVHELVFAIKRRNTDHLEQLVDEVSDPDSPSYANYLSHDELREVISNPESTGLVLHHLREVGAQIVQVTAMGEFIVAQAPVLLWERLLDCEFHVFQTKSPPFKSVVRCSQYSLEETLHSHVLSVFNAAHLPDPRPFQGAISINLTSASKDWAVTLSVLKQTYDLDISLGSNQSTQAVFAQDPNTYSLNDLNKFLQSQGLPKRSIGGDAAEDAHCQSVPADCDEGNLDVQYISAVGGATKTSFWKYTGDDFVLGFLLEISAMTRPPQVISISYGIEESYLTDAYATAFNTQAMALAAQGVTIVAASGDDGVAGPRSRKNPVFCGYRPVFPASSPYVTAVGGTMGPETAFGREVACQSNNGGIITTGGGFSTLYARPSFQNQAVAKYLSSAEGRAAAAGYNSQGRGYPDVAVLAFNYQIVLNGQMTLVSGTSASAPVMAAMLSLVNAQRAAVGRASLGWVNPVLYKYSSSIFYDVSDGQNNCAASDRVCCAQGFTANVGWDPVTGWGHPHFPRLLAALKSFNPTPSFAPTRAPTAPTRAPTRSSPSTPSPTVASAGWVTLAQYKEGNCEGSPYQLTSVPTGTCLPIYKVDQSTGEVLILGYIRYNCAADGASVDVKRYLTSQCSENHVDSQLTLFTGCAYHALRYYYSPLMTSTSLTCDAGDHRNAPARSEFSSSSYLLHRSYSNPSGCLSNSISEIDAVQQEVCMPIFHPPEQSYLFRGLELLVFSDTDCTPYKLVQRDKLSSQCVVAQNGDGGNDDVYMGGGDDLYETWQVILASSSPSLSPSPSPTTPPPPPSSGHSSNGSKPIDWGMAVLGFFVGLIGTLILVIGVAYFFFREPFLEICRNCWQCFNRKKKKSPTGKAISSRRKHVPLHDDEDELEMNGLPQ
eukprot:scaffold1623_cov165-Ochromonas_danica.AAC.10